MKHINLIMVVNGHFIPQRGDESYPFGVVGFSFATARELQDRGELVGLLLYERDDECEFPMVYRRFACGFNAVSLRFNFSMSLDRVRAAFVNAIRLLIEDSPNIKAGISFEDSIVVYHQTPALLHIHPLDVPFIVTHHGPLASEIIRLFGYKFAIKAFSGGEKKLQHLLMVQEEGINILKRSRRGMALEISPIQKDVLLRIGVLDEKIRVSLPPVQIEHRNKTEGTIRGNGGVLRIISAAARIDAFKNLDEIVQAANIIVGSGIPVELRLFAGDRVDQGPRNRLRALLSDNLKATTRISPRLPHAHLFEMFFAFRWSGVFVCSSLYETFGITPLEAALAGLVTIVPNCIPNIGIASYISEEYRYEPGSIGAAAKLTSLHSSPNLHALGIAQQNQLWKLIRTKPFMKCLIGCAEDLLDEREMVEQQQS